METDWTGFSDKERAMMEKFLASDLFAAMQREIEGPDELCVEWAAEESGLLHLCFVWTGCYTQEERDTVRMLVYDTMVTYARWLYSRGGYPITHFVLPDHPMLTFRPPETEEVEQSATESEEGEDEHAAEVARRLLNF